jgi:hypothetical protein
METIHPNNIPDLDINTISLITLKNGNMIMIDDSVAEKPRTKKIQGYSELSKNVTSIFRCRKWSRVL